MAKLKAFTMPKWGIEMSEGTIAEWLVEENAPFTKGTVLALIETDKITNEVEAEADGRFVRLIAEAGETYPVGALLAVLSDGAEASADDIEAVVTGFKPADTGFDGEQSDSAPRSEAPKVEKPAGPSPTPFIPSGMAISDAARQEAAASGVDVTTITGSGQKGRITLQDVEQAAANSATPELKGPYPETPPSDAFASPLARRLSHIHDIALDDIEGTGPRGRICKADVMARIPTSKPQLESGRASSPMAAPSYGDQDVEIVAMSSMRRTIARRLTEAKSTIPHFYVRRRVRADRLLDKRQRIDSNRPSVNDYLIRACALALMEAPNVNVQVHGTNIHRFARADIAVAVATDRGLVTPIVTGADDRSIADIASMMSGLAQRARSGKLTSEEFTGGSFSLSNLGGFGAEQFDAIINPPQGAILAVGRGRSEPIDDAGALRLVPVMHLSLSCDHRAIDGADAARFMEALANLIEQPDLLD